MNDEASEAPPGGEEPPEAGGQPSEEELYRRLDEELGKVRVEDVLLQSVVSLLNLAARRIVKEDERDLDQARLGIDAVRAVIDLLGERAKPIRDALSEVQLLYARQAEGAPAEGAAPAEPSAPEPPPRIWTPPGSTS